jgi:hypothetical protein
MSNDSLPDWEKVLTSAARLQQILPDAVLVGGTASALFFADADHVLPDLANRFDRVLADLESVAGWRTARVQRPVLGKLDGIETGVRQLIRSQPLETTRIERYGKTLVVPTQEEMLRIKGLLILQRNATRDYLDFAALAHHMGEERVLRAFRTFDRLYPQPNDQSALQQLQIQLANPLPYDLEGFNLAEYKQLDARWHDWRAVQVACADCAGLLFARLEGPQASMESGEPERKQQKGERLGLGFGDDE